MKRVAFGLLFCSIVTTFGCGSKEDGGSGVTTSGGASSSSGGSAGTGGGTGATSGTGGSDSGSGGAISLGGSTNTSSGGTGTVNEACAKATATASLSGLRMLVMFDRSSSMLTASGEGQTRWDLASSALNGFFASPSAAGLQVALRFFPHDLPAEGCYYGDRTPPATGSLQCDVASCAQPLVALGTLLPESGAADAQEAALLAATANATPDPFGMGTPNPNPDPDAVLFNGGTPTYAALAGAVQWAKAQRVAAPEEKSVIVLVTDGEPRGCTEDEEDPDNIAAIASEALASSEIHTYVIGLTASGGGGGPFPGGGGGQQLAATVDAIAEAGGTEQGIFVEDGATAQEELLQALNEIRGSALDCDFTLPEAEQGMQIDPNQINVNYTPSGGATVTLGRVPDAASCGASAGWYYDDPNSPSRILLCPASCTAAAADLEVSLEVLVGCVTKDRDPE